MGVIERARALRSQIEEVAATLTDETAVNYAGMFPAWSGNSFSYSVGDRVRYNGVLYKCLQAHTSQSSWSPAESPSLWAAVLSGQDGTEIGEWTQPDSTNAYMIGDRVTHNGSTWESTVDNSHSMKL